MEHILQIAISVDDDTIQKKVEDAAVKQVLKTVDEYGKYTYYSGESEVSKLFKAEIKKFIDNHAEEIVEKAIKELVRNMAKTKKVKDAIEEAFTGVEND